MSRLWGYIRLLLKDSEESKESEDQKAKNNDAGACALSPASETLADWSLDSSESLDSSVPGGVHSQEIPPLISMQQNSWLYSDSFLKRAFAIWGHAAVAHLIIMIPFMLLWVLVFGMIFSAIIRNVNLQPSDEGGPGGVMMEIQP